MDFMDKTLLSVELCRLCGQSSDNLFYIDDCDINLNVSSKVFECTTIEIKTDDSLSHFLCDICLKKILDFYDFRQKSLNVQIILKSKIDFNIRVEYNLTENQIENSFSDLIPLHETCLEEDLPKIDMESDDFELLSLSSEIDEEGQLIDVDYDESSSNDTNTKPEEQADDVHEESKNKTKFKSLLRSCYMCKKMVERSRMSSHINQHRGVRPYICDITPCKKAFYCSYSLTDHKRDYHSKEIHVCEICGKSYGLQKSLYNHQQKHKEAKFACTICNRRYHNNPNLKQHMRSHTGERPYKCKFCKRAFATQYNLKCHQRSHTKEKPYACSECGVSYGYNSLLKSHMEKYHG